MEYLQYICVSRLGKSYKDTIYVVVGRRAVRLSPRFCSLSDKG